MQNEAARMAAIQRTAGFQPALLCRPACLISQNKAARMAAIHRTAGFQPASL
jgi:hypothetical protein